ncbi:MAG: ABC transporter permease [Anaerolineae bacterium]|nr:ABC transporter permease [Anaerolineae bacterium]
MGKYIFRRILEALPVVIGVSILVFTLVRLIPGDPATVLLGERASPENVAALRERLGLNRSLPEQYFIWIGNILQGDLGTTIRGNVPIAAEIQRRFPATIELSLSALFLATVLGVPIGVISALRRNSWIDTLSMFFALFGVSIPVFVLGLLLIFLFGVQLSLFPFVSRLDSGVEVQAITGLYVIDSVLTGNWVGFWDALEHLVLPTLTLMTIPLAIIARITRSAMLEVLNQDYIRTAYAKGLPGSMVIRRHALRNALLPVVTIIGLQLGALLSGAVLTETIFSWPGIGKWLFDNIIARDYPIIQAVTLLIAMIYVVVNLAVDILYTFIDPRVRNA